MSDIKVIYIDGTEETFKDNGAPGGSYSNTIKHEGGFAVITDPFGNTTSIPSERINRVIHASDRRGF